MATLYLLDSVADTHLGTDNTNVLGTAVGWASKALGTARGSGVIASDNVATVTGATLGVTITKTSAVEWISPPVAADVTISGTITANIWASETNMSANVAINVIVDIIRANATATRNSNTIEQIVKSTNAVEVAVTTRAANNFTSGMTSGGYTGQTLNRGDRLRVRVFGDDVGAMAATYTFNASWNGTSAAADGDSYVVFAETITFESAPGVVATEINAMGSPLDTSFIQGATGASNANAQSFLSPSVASSLTQVQWRGGKTGSPTDNLVFEIQTDSGGVPSGSVVGTVQTISGASLLTTSAVLTYSCSIALSASTTYWLVARRSGARDTANYYFWNGDTTSTYAGGERRVLGATGNWIAGGETLFALWFVGSGPTTTLYLTDTASAVSTASVDREAWTSRGAGVQTDVRNTAAGWTAPLQLTDTAGGTVVDWFTRPLTAFTLTGMVAANLRALESNAAANASLRCEIARVEGDGTSPTVWASWCVAPLTTDNGELGTTEAARTANVSGDDLAITNGQRLRIRLYADDMSSAAMATANTVTLYYAGTSGGASGDSYITFPQTLTEYSAGPPTHERSVSLAGG